VRAHLRVSERSQSGPDRARRTEARGATKSRPIVDRMPTTSAAATPNLPAIDKSFAMISSPPSIDTRPRVKHAPAVTRERCPFLEQVGDVQPLARPRTLVHSSWRSEADARAGEVLAAFARTGGLASCANAALMLRRRTSQPVSMLGRWIVERRVVSFVWRGELLLPMFKFDRADMGVRAAVGAVLDELDGTFDDWDLATWFALPNAWLGDQAPVDAIDRDADAVRHAARADRFIARG